MTPPGHRIFHARPSGPAGQDPSPEASAAGAIGVESGHTQRQGRAQCQPPPGCPAAAPSGPGIRPSTSRRRSPATGTAGARSGPRSSTRCRSPSRAASVSSSTRCASTRRGSGTPPSGTRCAASSGRRRCIAGSTRHTTRRSAGGAATTSTSWRGPFLEGVRWSEENLSPLARLAATVALEHLTAILAAALLDGRSGSLAGADPRVAELWRWHAVEETEHKSVAFDVYAVVRRLPEAAAAGP